jgi:hypothetical protein
LYKLFINYNVGGMFVEPPIADDDGKVSTAALQANDILAGGFELILSILIALGGTVISITTGALKTLGELLGVSHYWEGDDKYEYVEEETKTEYTGLEATLLRAIEKKNKRLTIAVCEELAEDNYLTGGKDVP